MNIFKVSYLLILLISMYTTVDIVNVYEASVEENICITSDRSLLFGTLFVTTYGLHNARFFYDIVKLYWEIDKNKNQVVLDSTKDAAAKNNPDIKKSNERDHIGRILVSLWPSPAQHLTIRTERVGNFANMLEKCKLTTKGDTEYRNMDLKLLAAMLIGERYRDVVKTSVEGEGIVSGNITLKILPLGVNNMQEAIFEVRIPHNITSDSTSDIKDRIVALTNVLNLFFDGQDTVKKDWYLSKNLILQAYISRYIDTKDRLKTFYTIYDECIKEIKKRGIQMQQDIEVDRNMDILIGKGMDDIVSAIKSGNVFPYSQTCQPEDLVLYEYDRKNGRVSETNTYASCVENTLYHFLNSMLWNMEGGYMKADVQKRDGDNFTVREFFSGAQKRHLGPNECAKWTKIVGDIPGTRVSSLKKRPIVTEDFETSSKTLYYGKQDDIKGPCNMIKSGLINYLNALYCIFKKDNRSVNMLFKKILSTEENNIIQKYENNQDFDKFIDIKDVRNALEIIFRELLQETKYSLVETEIEVISASAEKMINRLDITCEFIVRRILRARNIGACFRIQITNGHTQYVFEWLKCENKITEKVGICKLLNTQALYSGRYSLIPCQCKLYQALNAALGTTSIRNYQISCPDHYLNLISSNYVLDSANRDRYIDNLVHIISEKVTRGIDSQQHKAVLSNVLLFFVFGNARQDCSGSIGSVKAISLIDKHVVSAFFVAYQGNMSRIGKFIGFVSNKLRKYVKSDIECVWDAIIFEISNLERVDDIASMENDMDTKIGLCRYMHKERNAQIRGITSEMTEYHEITKSAIGNYILENEVTHELHNFEVFIELSSRMVELIYLIKNEKQRQDDIINRFTMLYEDMSIILNMYPEDMNMWRKTYDIAISRQDLVKLSDVLWIQHLNFSKPGSLDVVLEADYPPKSKLIIRKMHTMSNYECSSYGATITALCQRMALAVDDAAKRRYCTFIDSFINEYILELKSGDGSRYRTIQILEQQMLEKIKSVDPFGQVDLSLISIKSAKYIFDLIILSFSGNRIIRMSYIELFELLQLVTKHVARENKVNDFICLAKEETDVEYRRRLCSISKRILSEDKRAGKLLEKEQSKITNSVLRIYSLFAWN